MTIRTASAAQSTVQPKGLRVGLTYVSVNFSLGAGQSLSAGDIIQMVKVPANTQVAYLAVGCTTPDTSFGVGDDLSVNRYFSTATRSSAQGLITMNQLNIPYTYSTDDTIDIGVTAASITTITGGFVLRAIFSMDPDPH